MTIGPAAQEGAYSPHAHFAAQPLQDVLQHLAVWPLRLYAIRADLIQYTSNRSTQLVSNSLVTLARHITKGRRAPWQRKHCHCCQIIASDGPHQVLLGNICPAGIACTEHALGANLTGVFFQGIIILVQIMSSCSQLSH